MYVLYRWIAAYIHSSINMKIYCCLSNSGCEAMVAEAENKMGINTNE